MAKETDIAGWRFLKIMTCEVFYVKFSFNNDEFCSLVALIP